MGYSSFPTDESDMFPLPPSSKRLFQALDAYTPVPKSEEEARDFYPLHSALSDWKNALYSRLPRAEYESGTWPASPELLDAMRAALADQRGNYAGDELAYCLVRCGCRQAETIAGLSAWDAQLFRWSAAGLRARDLLAKFAQIGVAGSPEPDDLDRLDRCLLDPAAALAHYSSGNVTGTVLKGKTFLASLYSSGDDHDHSGLFEKMASHAGLGQQITNVRQTAMNDEDFTASAEAQLDGIVPHALKKTAQFADPETYWKMSFDVEGTSQTVFIPGSFAWMNDVALALQFDALLARLGRPERVLRFGAGRNEGDSFWGHYIIAEPRQFSALCGELGIPLDPFTTAGQA